MRTFGVAFILLTLISAQNAISDEPSGETALAKCNVDLNKLALNSQARLSLSESDFINKLFYEYSVLSPGPFFDRVVFDALAGKNFYDYKKQNFKLEKIKPLSHKAKLELSDSILRTLISRFSDKLPVIWGAPSQNEVNTDSAMRQYGFVNREEFEMAGRLVLKIDQNRDLRARVTSFIATNLLEYARVYNESQDLQNQKNGLTFYTEGLKDNGDVFHLVVTGGVATVIGHIAGHAVFDGFSPMWAAVGGSVPFILDAMWSFTKKYFYKADLKKFQTVKPQLPGETDPFGDVVIDIVEDGGKPAEATKLSEADFNPQVDFNSPSGLEHFGMEIEHGIHIASFEVGSFLKRGEDRTSRQALSRLLEIASKQSDAYAYSSELSKRFFLVEKELQKQLTEVDALAQQVNLLERLLDKYSQYLNEQRTAQSHLDSHLSEMVQEKLDELERFKEVTDSMSSVVASQRNLLSQTRKNIVEIMRQLSFEVSQNRRGQKVQDLTSYKLLQKAMAP